MKVTEKNMAMIMGRINKFFEKDTKVYLGIGKRVVGKTTLTLPGGSIAVPVYEDYERYEPIVGRCKVHWMRKKLEDKIKNNGYYTLTAEEEYDYHNILLAIEDKYSVNCIPIYAGFDVKITGNSLIIRENDTYSKVFGIGDDYPKTIKVKNKATYEYFYHMPISEDELKERTRDGIMSLFELSDQSYYFDNHEFDSDENELHSILRNYIYDLITKIDLDADSASLRVDIDSNCSYELNDDIFIHINIESIKKNGISDVEGISDLFYYTYGEEKFTSLHSLMNKIMNK